MTKLEKTIVRWFRIRSAARGMPDRDWIVELSPPGIVVRERGRQDVRYRMTWYEVLGTMVAHGTAQLGPGAEEPEQGGPS